MNEKQIKSATLKELVRREVISPAAVVANEFKIGQSGVRADLAVMDEIFIGIEIKSQFDSLRRLKGQLETYLETFDKVILVVSESHARNLDRHAYLGDAEVWKIDLLGKITRIKRGKTSINTRIEHLSKLLYKRDLAGINQSSGQELRTAVLKRFINKFGPTSEVFWNSVQNSEISEQSLEHLSPFKPLRKIVELRKEKRKTNFSKWIES